ATELDDGLQLFVVGEDPPGFAVSHDLARMQAVDDGVRARPTRLAFVEATGRARGVVQHFEAITAGNVEDGVHVARIAELVDRNDCLPAWRNSVFYVVGLDVPGIWIHFAQYRSRTAMAREVGGGDETDGGNDHLVPGAKFPCAEYHEPCCCP